MFLARTVFLREFFKNWRRTGSVTPSSRFLIEKMLEPIDFSRARTIVELGAADGCITRAILARMRPDARLMVLEVNRAFAPILGKIRDPRATFLWESAEKLPALLKHAGCTTIDVIVSSLPLGGLPRSMQKTILRNVHTVLAPHSRFIQYQYSLLSYRLLKKTFARVSLAFTMLNIPPAVVYVCEKKKETTDVR